MLLKTSLGWYFYHEFLLVMKIVKQMSFSALSSQQFQKSEIITVDKHLSEYYMKTVTMSLSITDYKQTW